jgi:lipoate-protein ligase A
MAETAPHASPVRLLIDEPADGAWNMAADEVLGEAAERGLSTLRFYRWRPATLSLGYFQSLAERAGHPASTSCEVVRRTSGGGAILHDLELTYSFAEPVQGARGDQAARQLYRDFHESLIRALAEFGVAAELCGDARCAAACSAQPSFMCFSRRAREDVLVGETKVAGSAQRRQRTALVQHGSVLLSASPFAPELPGLAELGARGLDFERLAKAWLPLVSERLSRALAPSDWSGAERSQIADLAESKYRSLEWTGRR